VGFCFVGRLFGGSAGCPVVLLLDSGEGGAGGCGSGLALCASCLFCWWVTWRAGVRRPFAVYFTCLVLIVMSCACGGLCRRVYG
jgi:hypothetical protein